MRIITGMGEIIGAEKGLTSGAKEHLGALEAATL